MTPQLHLKLQKQAERQQLELTAVQLLVTQHQSIVAEKQAVVDQLKLQLEQAQLTLTDKQAQSTTEQPVDTTAEQLAVDQATAALVEPEKELSVSQSMLSEHIARSTALQESILQCQQELSASNLTEDNIVAYQQEVLVEVEQKQEQVRVASLWQSAHDYEFQQISGSAIGLLAMGVMMQKPKCIAVQNWIKGIWTIYYTRKATGETSTDYSSAGTIPHTVPELMQELGV